MVRNGFYNSYIIVIYGSLSKYPDGGNDYHVISCIEFQTFDDPERTTYTYLFDFISNSILGRTWQLESNQPTIITPKTLPGPTTPEPQQKTISQLEDISTAERNYYAYTLRYPDGTPFYVGKGHGDRVHAHVRGYRQGDDGSIKHRVIGDILRAGLQVVKHIEVDGLYEQDALKFESVLISHLEQSYLLVNYSGRYWIEERHEQVMATLKQNKEDQP